MPYGSGGRAGIGMGLQQAFSGLGDTLMNISEDRRRKEELERQRAMDEERMGLARSSEERAAGQADFDQRTRVRQADESRRERARQWGSQGYRSEVVDAPPPGLVNAGGVPREGDVPGYGAALTELTRDEPVGRRESALAVSDVYDPERDLSLRRSTALGEERHGQNMELERLRQSGYNERARMSGSGSGGADSSMTPHVQFAAARLTSQYENPTAALEALRSGETGIADELAPYVERELMNRASGLFWEEGEAETGGIGNIGTGGSPRVPSGLFPRDEDGYGYDFTAPEGDYNNPVTLPGVGAAPPGVGAAPPASAGGPPAWFVEQHRELAGAAGVPEDLDEAWQKYSGGGGG